MFNKLNSFLFLLVFVCAGARAGLFFPSKKVDLNPDYTKTYWDALMQQQSKSDIFRGIMLYSGAQYEEAAASFARAVFKNPGDATAHILFGVSLYWTGQVDAAMSEYRRAIELDPDDAQPYQLLAIAHGWKGERDSAYENFKKAESLDNKRADVKFNLSSVYAARGEIETALDYSRSAVELAPKDPLFNFALGTILEELGRDAQAADAFKAALKHYPRYEEAMLALAALYEKQGDNKEALSYYKKAVHTKPGDFVARLRYANLLFLSEGAEKARKIVESAFAITDNSQSGLALTIAYSKPPGASPSSSAAGDVENMLKKLPPGEEINVEMEINYSDSPPEPEEREKGLLEQEFERLSQAASARTFRRNFILNAADDEGRARQIKYITDGVSQVLDSVTERQKLDINIKTSPVERGAPSASKNTGAYNPRNIGNDMGLWTMGSAWVSYVQEVMPEIRDRLESGSKEKSFDYILLGLGYLTLGSGYEALAAFDRAEALGEAELAALGKGTAFVVLGAEDKARAVYKKVLELYPANIVAQHNLARLEKGQK